MNVLTIGGATLDTIIEYEKMETIQIQQTSSKKSYIVLEEGAKIEVSKQKSFSGGGATNAAVSLQKLGFNVKFFGKLGKDNIGKLLLEELKNQGVDTSLVRFSNNYNTSTSYVVPSLKGDRTIFAYRGANRDLLNEDLPVNAIKESDFVYVTSLSQYSAVQLPEIVKIAKKYNTKVSINPGYSQLELGSNFILESIKDIDILILNYQEAKKLMNSLITLEQNNNITNFSVNIFLKTILNLGPRIVVITNGSDGVYVAHKKNIYFHPTIKVKYIVNTLGAGDAFGSSFCGAIYNNESIDTAIYYGLINSSSVIQFHDAKTGLLHKDEIIKKISQTDYDKISILE